MTRTVVLTSKKNYAWQSMQEIIPFIESVWFDSADLTHDVSLLNIDDTTVLKNVASFMNIDNIVMTCFTVEIALGVAALRSKLGLDFRIIFYVHGMATIGYWPLYKFELGHHLVESDVFVVTCEGDKKLTEMCMPKISIVKHPFLNNREMTLNTKGNITELVYIGRISEQKNLHVLIEAIHHCKEFLRDHKLVLRVFGEEDHLGSPNMGKLSSNYQTTLNTMVKELKLENYVIFEGHVSRKKLDDYLASTHCLYISASLHSDENFGMSPFNILSKGGSCLLTDWGGFSEFREPFGGQVQYIDVCSGNYGPFIRVDNISTMIKKCILEQKSQSIFHVPEYYSKKYISSNLNLTAKSSVSSKKIVMSEIVKTIVDCRDKFYKLGNNKNKNHGAQIFNSYKDELANTLLDQYSGSNCKNIGSQELQYLEIVNWVCIEKKQICINEPRLGRISIQNESEDILSKKNLFILDDLGCLYK